MSSARFLVGSALISISIGFVESSLGMPVLLRAVSAVSFWFGMGFLLRVQAWPWSDR